MSNAGLFSAFLLLLLLAWVVIPSWAWATWSCRYNPYARARHPAGLVAEMATSTFAITTICLDEMLRCLRLSLPCRLIKVTAALHAIVVPTVVL